MYKNVSNTYQEALEDLKKNLFSTKIENSGGKMVSRNGDIVLDTYIKIRTKNDQYPYGIKGVKLIVAGIHITDYNLVIIKIEDHYLVASDITLAPFLLIKMQYNELRVDYELEKDNNITEFIGIQSTYLLIDNPWRKYLATHDWDIENNFLNWYTQSSKGGKIHNFERFIERILSGNKICETCEEKCNYKLFTGHDGDIPVYCARCHVNTVPYFCLCTGKDCWRATNILAAKDQKHNL